MTIKDSIYRELKYGLCGSGGSLEGIVAQNNLKQDMRLEPDSEQSESSYPWLIFRVISEQDGYNVLERVIIEFEIIGKQSSGSKGDDLLEVIKEALKVEFNGKHKTWGKYEDDGTPDPDGGVKMRSSFSDTTESFDDLLDEKIQTVTFRFARVA